MKRINTFILQKDSKEYILTEVLEYNVSHFGVCVCVCVYDSEGDEIMDIKSSI